MKRLIAPLVIVTASLIVVPLIAQESEEAQKSGFLRFVEDRLSTPDRRIAINGLDGALSSEVKIDEITFSDGQGVWLRIENAELKWNRGALLTGRLLINSLSADSIDYIRAAIPTETRTAPAPEANTFEVPEFPVAITLEELSVSSVRFGEDVFGLGSEVSVEGHLILQGGSLDTDLDIVRKDGPGGTLDIAVRYAKDSNVLDLNILLTEPENGVVVNLLNIENRPELELRLNGSGPVDTLVASLTLDAGGNRALTGTANLSQSSKGLAVQTDLHGPVGDLMPSDYRQFFGTETNLTADMLLREGGGITLNALELAGGEIHLSATADTTTDGFLSHLGIDATIAGVAGERVLLPVAGAATSLESAHLSINYGDSDVWAGTLLVDGLQTADTIVDNITIDLTGAALNIATPDQRRITFNADGNASGIRTDDPEIADAIGNNIAFGMAGLWNAGEALEIIEARLLGKALDVALSGQIKDWTFDGKVGVATPSIAPFSGLAGRQLSGAIDIAANGKVELLTGGFDLNLEGKANNLEIGIEALDKILVGDTILAGRLGRTPDGFTAEKFSIDNDNARITANGQFSSTSADFNFNMALADLGLLSDNAGGAMSMHGTARSMAGEDGPISLALTASIPNGRVEDRRIADAQLAFTGDLLDGEFTGNVEGTAFLDGHRVSLNAQLATTEEEKRLSNLKFETLGTLLTGDITQNNIGLLSGNLDLKSTDISMAAALLLTKAEGAANASIGLSHDEVSQSAHIKATVRQLKAVDTEIGSADIEAQIDNLFGVPAIKATINGTNISAAGIDIATLAASANQSGNTTSFNAKATLDNNTNVALAGSLSPLDGGYHITLDSAALTQGSLTAKLSQPTALTVSDGGVSLNAVELDIAGGHITASGTAGDSLAINIDIARLPLSFANTIRPDLGLGGSIAGTMRITGDPTNPEIIFDVSANNVTAAAIAPYNITPLSGAASGSYKQNTIRLAALQLSSPTGLKATANGTMPLVGSNGNLSVKGTFPLTLASTFVGDRGTQISGTVAINANISGSLASPKFSGTVRTDNAQIVDPLSNLRLNAISASAAMSRGKLIIESLSGSLATGGSINASGSINIDNPDLPANINISLNSARYADGNLFVTTASGQLALTGPLLRNPLLSGALQLENTEISIANLSGGDGAFVNVDHIALPSDVAATLKRARADADAKGNQHSSDLQLDVSISAPNQIFVRGRGVDAELGGTARLTGSISNIQPTGGFELIRGRLNILGQRIVFTSGRVTLVGDLDPYVEMTARTTAESTTIFVNVVGPASELDITFSSDPSLPQDEILSLLIFKRALGDLSPLQLAKLAGAAAELAGGNNNSLVDGLRQATGLDDLDIVTDDNGNAAVRAGRYIQDNVYVNIEAGAEGTGKVSIDLDLSESLKARVGASNDGETSLGIFFEQDY